MQLALASQAAICAVFPLPSHSNVALAGQVSTGAVLSILISPIGVSVSVSAHAWSLLTVVTLGGLSANATSFDAVHAFTLFTVNVSVATTTVPLFCLSG